MAIHKLLIDDFVTIDFELIAIHSSLEDYRLAYFINRDLGLMLEKSPENIGITIPEGETSFSRFIYDDPSNDCKWSLIQNKNRVVSNKTDITSLFEDNRYSVTTNVFMLPEFKKVDYILKIENTPCEFTIDSLVDNLLSIKYVATAYTIDHTKLKSKNNLIF
jgi:hypothetical protein